MSIFDILIEFKSIIVTCLILLGLIIFRKEFNKLLDWVVSFRKIAGTKGEYKVSAETETPGSRVESKLKDGELRSPEEKGGMIEGEKPGDEKGWHSFFLEKKYDKTLEILEKDLNSEHDNEKRNTTIGLIGYVKFKKDNKEGTEYFEETLKKIKGSSEIYHWYGLSYYLIEEYNQAINKIKMGIEANPNAFVLYDLFADCLVRQSKEIEAVEMLFDQLKQNPNIPSYYTKIAEILSEIGKDELARDCCRLGIKYCPDDTSLLEKYGSIVSNMDDYKEAMFVYLRLVTKRPEKAEFWVLLGNQYLNLSFNDLALEAYKKGNELAKESEEWIISNIGNLMKNRGFYTEGASYFKKGISIEPNSQYAHERLAQALKAANDEAEKRDGLKKELVQVVKGFRSSEDIISEAKVASSQPSAQL